MTRSSNGNIARLNVEDNQEASSLRGRNLDSKTPIWQHDQAWIRRPAKFVRSAWLLLTPRSGLQGKGRDYSGEGVSFAVDVMPTGKHAGLGAVSVACLIFNRIINPGFFNSSSVILYTTQSVGVSLMMWLYGAVMMLSGLVLYIELGLTVPRLHVEGAEVSAPRSGGELVYFKYFIKAPKYLATCLFGVSFVIFANTATSSVVFAVAVLQAAGATRTAATITGIAIAVNTFSCVLHSASRQWGIRLNNLFGTLKLLMLVIMIIFGIVWNNKSIADTNFDRTTAFSKTPGGVSQFTEALVYAIFSFGGFQQANYVLGEIKNPRRNFAWTSAAAVCAVCILFMALNILYPAVIPKEVLFQPGNDMAREFLIRTVGRTSDPLHIETASNTLRAFLAIGNVIVITFTAARVTQEAAKEGIFPFAHYLAASYHFSLPQGFRRLSPHESNIYVSQPTPAAALAVHWTVTTALILATVLGGTAETAPDGTFYLPGVSLLGRACSYGLDMAWFTVVGAAMLCLRLWPGSEWRHKSPIPHVLGVLSAAVFTATAAFPLAAIWVPNPAQPFLARTNGKIPWFASQTMTMAILGAAGAYWVGFKLFLWRRGTRHDLELHTSTCAVFARDERAPSGLVFLYEEKQLEWKSRTLESWRNAAGATELADLELAGAPTATRWA